MTEPKYKIGQNVMVWGCWGAPYEVMSMQHKNHYGSLYFWEYEIRSANGNGYSTKISEDSLLPWRSDNLRKWIRAVA